MCDCHPRSSEDEAMWKKAKMVPPTKQEWAMLHDFIESYKSLRIYNFKQQAGVSMKGVV